MANLASLTGKFDKSGTYKPKQYSEVYLKKLVDCVNNVQSNVKKVSNQLHNTVMVEGKWYDDCAAEFAKWWNDNGSTMDGVNCLNQISIIVEELVRITAVNVCVEMMSLVSIAKTAGKQTYIANFGKGNEYIYGIENINKKNLGNIAKTECNDEVGMTANQESLNNMVKEITSAFEAINENVKQIQQLIKYHLLEGNTISFSGLDGSTLNQKINKINNCMETIQNNLYSKLQEDQNNTNLTTKQLKSVLETNYSKSAGSSDTLRSW